MTKGSKSISRSVRMTELTYQFVESMPPQYDSNGKEKGFNQKFEDLVFKCYCELPEAEERLKELNNDIKRASQKQREIDDFLREVRQVTYSLENIERNVLKKFEKICNS